MWELIRANKRNSIYLMIIMAICLVVLGFLLGRVFAGPAGSLMGIIVATAIWLILMVVSFSSGDQVLLAASKAVPVTHDVHPQLFNVVEEMSISAGLPMPKVYIIKDPAPNAFATGRKPESASIAVTAGLLGKLNRDELQGVVAHEMSHIMNRDILFVTMAGVMLGSIVILSQILVRGVFYSSLSGSRRRYSSGGKGNPQAQLIMLGIAILAAILAPIFAQLLYFALSRRREYLADAGAARLTRYPEGLANALEKISNDSSPQLSSASKATAPLYIINPLKKKKSKKVSDFTSTHPSIQERIRILRNMMHGANYRDYAKSYQSVKRASHSPMPSSALKDKSEVKIREKSGIEDFIKDEKIQNQMHQIGDIIRQVDGFVFLTCACGLKFKIPPNYKKDKVVCPKCKRKHDLKDQK